MAEIDSSTTWSTYAVKLWIVSCYCLQFYCAALMDTISVAEPVTVSKSISSPRNHFELGFFRAGNSPNYFAGIWYKKINGISTVVWVANRDHPFTRTGSSMVLTITKDGNLVIMAGEVNYMVTNISSAGNYNSTVATLLDSGNLVLRDKTSNKVLWQSFDFPTDTLLPGMKIGYDKSSGKSWSLTSWKSNNDPGPGIFSILTDPDGTPQLFIMKGSEVCRTSGTWNGENFSLLPELRSDYRHKIRYVSNQKMSYFSLDAVDNASFTVAGLVIGVNGQIQLISWLLEKPRTRKLVSSQPRVACDVPCGRNGACHVYSAHHCTCLTGFEPRFPYNWDIQFYSEGCTRKTNLSCSNSKSNVSPDRFEIMSHLGLPTNPQILEVKRFNECESACLNNCSCTAFSYESNECKLWEGDLLEVQQLTNVDPSGKDLHLKVAASDELYNKKINAQGSKRKLWIITTSAISFTILASFIFICWTRNKRPNKKEAGEDLLSFDFSSIPAASNYKATEEDLKQGKSKGNVDKNQIPMFRFSSIAAATNDFSSSNKLGEGGFGPVYKGRLLNGEEVAVKRLSRRSGQGLEQLRNETVLIAKLQHKNLVRLLGCCIEGDEKILIYEYLENKSLDSFLFDPMKHGMLDWETRVCIIEGIAQGLLYLHKYSRLQIIHRDLKVSNILLDKDMKPKISDFGMARIFGGDDPQATDRIVGTYGYMAPEYALEGIFSVKSDVFSFGVLLLEILSGKKNTSFYNTNSLSLLIYAWDLWKSGKSMELMDPILGDSCSANELVKYISIGLLCVQETASQRPTMSDVVSMLSDENAALPEPKQPAFSHVRTQVVPSSSCQEICSVGDVTVSVVEAR